MAAGYDAYRDAVAAHLRALGGSPVSDEEARALATLIVGVADGLLIQWLLDPGGLPSPADLVRSLRAIPAQ